MAEAAAEKRSRLASKEHKSGGQNTGAESSVKLSFYDAGTHALLLPPEGAEIELLHADGTQLATVALHQDKDNRYCINVPSPGKKRRELSSDEENVEELEIPCDVPRESSPALVISQFREPVSVNNQLYQSMSTAIDYPTKDQETCAPVPIALTKLEESYTFGILAYDSCIADYIAHPEALLDEVRLQLREVEGLRQASAAGTRSGFRGREFSAMTKNGYAEISGLTFGQLYEVQIGAPAGYVYANPTPQRLFFNRSHTWLVPFQPCGAFPSRSVIFVQKACPGVRVQSMTFMAGGGSQCVSEKDNGIWNIKPGTTGRIDFQAVGKTFSPASIELNEEAPLVFVVAVSEQTAGVLSASERRRFRFVDEHGEPFANRKLRLVSRNGYEESVVTDDVGFFEADEGSRAWADDDEWGHALEGTLLITEGD